MSTELFYPPVKFVPRLKLTRPVTIRELCSLAQTPCRATGAWTERKVELREGTTLLIEAEPGDWGSIVIEVPPCSPLKKYRQALQILAYALHDPVAKQSVIGSDWAKVKPPKGRPKLGQALTTAERQRRFRLRRARA